MRHPLSKRQALCTLSSFEDTIMGIQKSQKGRLTASQQIIEIPRKINRPPRAVPGLQQFGVSTAVDRDILSHFRIGRGNRTKQLRNAKSK